jgi:hypothetical protein
MSNYYVVKGVDIANVRLSGCPSADPLVNRVVRHLYGEPDLHLEVIRASNADAFIVIETVSAP